MIINVINYFISFILKIINYRKCTFNIGAKISIRTKLEGNNVLGKYTNLMGTKIGYSSYVSHNSEIINSKIGKFTSIGKNVKTIIGAHPTKSFVSTSPLFYSTKSVKDFKEIFTDKTKFEEFKNINGNVVEIGNDVWIGDNVSLMQGIKIGDGAVVGANSLVLTDVPEYSIVVGSPAKVKKYRFSTEIIQKLLNIKWWNKDKKWILENKDMFDDIDLFIEAVEKR